MPPVGAPTLWIATFIASMEYSLPTNMCVTYSNLWFDNLGVLRRYMPQLDAHVMQMYHEEGVPNEIMSILHSVNVKRFIPRAMPQLCNSSIIQCIHRIHETERIIVERVVKFPDELNAIQPQQPRSAERSPT